MRIVGGGLGEGTGFSEGAKNLVGGDVEETEGGVWEFGQVCAGRLEQVVGADDVGLDEVSGAVDRAVDVGFGGEVHHPIGAKVIKGGGHRGGIADVGLEEAVVGVVPDLGE